MHAQRPLVLTLVAAYLPGFKSGGPIRSIASLIEAAGDTISFRIVTRDRDSGDDRPYPGIVTGIWRDVGKASVLYAEETHLSLRAWRRLLKTTTYDVLYLNSYFSFDFTIKPLILRRIGLVPALPVVLAPRGQFADSALGLKSLKKNLFLAVARLAGLYRGLTWQATSPHEVDDIRRVIGDHANIVLAEVPRADKARLPTEHLRRVKEPGRLTIAFLGRVARMKNLDFACRSLMGLRGSVSVDVYGPMEDEPYWRECEDIIRHLPPGISVDYRGPVPYEAVMDTLAGYDLFFLPTRGENFGHAIVDALLAGCPVLISDKTPWRNLEQAGCGWDIPLSSQEAFRDILQRCIDMSEADVAVLRARAVEFGQEQLGNAAVIRRNVELFLSSLEH